MIFSFTHYPIKYLQAICLTVSPGAHTTFCEHDAILFEF